MLLFIPLSPLIAAGSGTGWLNTSSFEYLSSRAERSLPWKKALWPAEPVRLVPFYELAARQDGALGIMASKWKCG